MSGFADQVSALLAPLGQISVRRMFGGHGVYCDDLFIAILHDGTLWLKTDAESRERFEHAGGEPFEYRRKGETASLGFHSPPPEALESPPEMLVWARLAMQAALRARSAKRPVRRKQAATPRASPGAGSHRGSTPSPGRRRG